MNVQHLMTANPACCHADASLQEIAQMMVENDCGCIPVVDSSEKPIGVITDRDICCRAVAQGRNPLELRAEDCMSKDVVTVSPNTSVEECFHLMEQNRIRRIPVVDADGRCCGMVAQADVARQASEPHLANVIEEISQPGQNARAVGGR